MASDKMRILIVAEDHDTIAELTAALVTNTEADLAITGSVQEAGSMAAPDAFDLILAADRLPDGSGLALLDGPIFGDTPLVMLDRELDADRVLAALRAGALDVFAAPFTTDSITRIITRAVRTRRENRRRQNRMNRSRRLSSRLIRDRRELRQRVDLICRDLVGAYRRLAEKAVACQDGGSIGEVDHTFDAFGRNAHIE